MKTIIAIVFTCATACIAAPTTQKGKIFPNDPDISPGQPFWTEWQITTELINKVDTIPECTLPEKQVSVEQKYYWSPYDISTCSGPNYPCITVVKANKDDMYIPYFTWTTFQNIGTFKKPVWTMDFWFNYNQTATYQVGESVVCNDKTVTYELNPCVFTDKANKYKMDYKYDITCSRDVKTGYLNLDVYQTDDSGKTFRLHNIVNWQPYTSIVRPTTEVVYASVASTIPPKNQVEKN
jgi:hypothetical protein